MHIGTIVAVGIDNQAFLHNLEEHGYTIVTVDAISEVLSVTIPFDMMMVSGELLSAVNDMTVEQLYFANNSTPVALLVKDSATVSPSTLTSLSGSSLDILYDFEIDNGAIYQRVDKLFIAAKLNNHLSDLQQNFTQQKTLEQEISLRERILEHEREVNANILTSITAGLIIFDMSGTVILANDPARLVLKDTGSDIIGSPYASLLPDEMSELVDHLMREIGSLDNRPASKKCKIGNIYLDVYCYRMMNYQNQPSGILMLINDITEQEQMNVLLYRSEKLATVGTMLSGIAHELRNPLAIISARVQRALSKRSYDKEWLQKSFSSIQTQTVRCASIVNNLLDFTRNTATNAGYHRVTEILDETLTYVNYQNIFDNITVNKYYDEEVLVFGDRSRFVQIFLNLITNAADAMEGDGTLTIRTSLKQPATTLVEINDSGPGIAAAIQEKIFDPFFTTKEPGKGTGLGLAIVYKIVQESNGKIWCTSRKGSTSFFVELPSERVQSYGGTYTAR